MHRLLLHRTFQVRSIYTPSVKKNSYPQAWAISEKVVASMENPAT